MAEGSVVLRRKDRGANAVRPESLAVLALLLVVISLPSPYFLSIGNFTNILLATSVIGIVALGMTFVICMGEIDLSVGSVLALASVCGVLMAKPLGLPWPMVIVVSLGTGALVGLVNGLLVTRAGIPSF